MKKWIVHGIELNIGLSLFCSTNLYLPPLFPPSLSSLSSLSPPLSLCSPSSFTWYIHTYTCKQQYIDLCLPVLYGFILFLNISHMGKMLHISSLIVVMFNCTVFLHRTFFATLQICCPSRYKILMYYFLLEIFVLIAQILPGRYCCYKFKIWQYKLIMKLFFSI